MPISPLLSTARAQAAHPASIQRRRARSACRARWASGESTASAPKACAHAHVERVELAAGDQYSGAQREERRAPAAPAGAPNSRRAGAARSARPRRAATGRSTGAPASRARRRARTQPRPPRYCSGGFSKYLMPFSRGVDPVAALRHLARYLAVAGFVGLVERTRAPAPPAMRRRAGKRAARSLPVVIVLERLHPGGGFSLRRSQP